MDDFNVKVGYERRDDVILKTLYDLDVTNEFGDRVQCGGVKKEIRVKEGEEEDSSDEKLFLIIRKKKKSFSATERLTINQFLVTDVNFSAENIFR